MSIQPLVHSLMCHARDRGSCPAFLVDDRDISFDRHIATIATIARELRGRHLSRGERVLIYAPNSPRYAAAYFAIHAVGCVAVPLGSDLPPAVAASIAEDCEAKLALSEADSGLPIPTIDLVSVATFERDAEPLDPICRLDDVADILYTTGTTGREKGVVLTHGNVAHAAANINRFVQSRPEDVEIVPIPLGHSFGLGRLRCAAQTGNTLILEDGMRNAARLLKRLLDVKATGLSLVPAGFELLLRLGKDRLGDARDHLRYIEIGSAPMRMEVKRTLMELLPNTRICHHYGLTEASRSVFVEYHAEKDRLDSIGRAAPNVEVSIRDPEGRTVRPGEPGELVVRGGMVMREYWRQPELTGQVLHDGWLRTGDWGSQDEDGYFYLAARQSDLINVGGLKVNPVEVETELAACPGVEEALCVGIPDPQEIRGEVVKAFIVTSADIEDRDLIARLRQRLEEHKIPRVFQRLDELPKTVAGKIQRHLVRGNENAGCGRDGQ